MIDARGKNVIALRRAHWRNKRRDPTDRDERGRGRVLCAFQSQICRRRQREQWILIEGHQGIDECRIKKCVVFVSCEKKSAILSAIQVRYHERAAQSKPRIVLLQRQTLYPERIVLPRIRVQRFIAKEIECPAAKLVRTGTREQVDAATRSPAIFSSELIANNLNFFNRLDRRREPLGGRTIVVVVEPVDRDVVRIRGAAG